MSFYVGVELSDHLSSLKPASRQPKADAKLAKKKSRKVARASRRRNRR